MDAASGLPLLLASRSPRRAMMLRAERVWFVQRAPSFDDPATPKAAAGEDPQAVARGLAERKAASLDPATLGETVYALTADTLGVADDGALLGTPTCRAAARSMLRGLLGRAHDIVTAAVLRHPDGRLEPIVDTARVTLGRISDRELEAYLDTGAWRGKAGGYNLAERQAAGWPITVAGDPCTVMGLPMACLLPRLTELGLVGPLGD